jgi:cell division protein FtsI (penicillin-binding protein 3)
VDWRSNPKHATRLFVLAGAVFLWVFIIFWRLVWLQVARHEALLEEARRQQYLVTTIPAQRGPVLDRNGRLLAKTLFLDSVSVNPRQVPHDEVAAEILSGTLSVNRQELLERMRLPLRCPGCHKPVEGRRGFVWVKRRISPEESERIRDLANSLKWIQTTREPQRYYPNGALAAHVVGSVSGEGRGNLGLEQALEKELAGTPGRIEMLRDVRERPIESRLARAVEHGAAVTLTLDAGIQFVAERELRTAVEAGRAETGSVVVLKPATGEILAMASYPTFDPAVPPQPGEPDFVRFNHALSVPFEPGSVFKIVTLSAALDIGVVKPEDQVFCYNGRFSMFGRVVHEAKSGFGWLPASEVLVKSSNIGAIQIGMKVGERSLLEYVRRFGFGGRTGLSLPAESGGTVRDLPRWGKTSIGSVAMGHEISTTTLQLARACAVIANGGLLVKPRLILHRQKPPGKRVAEPVEPPRRVLQPETAIVMRRIMEEVVLRGTGRRARLDGYSSGGKTGTAQIYDPVSGRYTGRYNGSFVGFAPVGNPAVVVAVTLNGVHEYGGIVAAPVFRTVATEALLMLDVPKDLPEPVGPPAREKVEADDLAIAEVGAPPEDLAAPHPSWQLAKTSLGPAAPAPVGAAAEASDAGPRTPVFTGKSLRAVLEESLARGVPVEVVGTGMARSQTPPGGSPLAPGQLVRVEFR